MLLRCSLLRGSPQRIASAVWRFKGQLLPPPAVLPAAAEAPDHAELRLDAVTRESSGSYECSVSNDVGSAACLFQVSGEHPVGPTRTWGKALSQSLTLPVPLMPACPVIHPSFSRTRPGQVQTPPDATQIQFLRSSYSPAHSRQPAVCPHSRPL